MRIRFARVGQAEIWSCKKVSSNLCSNFLTSAPRALRLGFQLKWTQIGWRIRIKVTRCMPCVKTCEMEEPVRPAILCCDRPLMNRSLMMAFNNWGLNVISDLKTFLSAEKITRISPGNGDLNDCCEHCRLGKWCFMEEKKKNKKVVRIGDWDRNARGSGGIIEENIQCCMLAWLWAAHSIKSFRALLYAYFSTSQIITLSGSEL